MGHTHTSSPRLNGIFGVQKPVFPRRVKEFLHLLGFHTLLVWMWLRYSCIINFYTYFCHLDPCGPSSPFSTLEAASINFPCRWTCPASNKSNPGKSQFAALSWPLNRLSTPWECCTWREQVCAPAMMTYDDCFASWHLHMVHRGLPQDSHKAEMWCRPPEAHGCKADMTYEILYLIANHVKSC